MITIGFLPQNAQTGYGAHPAFYSMGAGEYPSLWKSGQGTKLPSQPLIMRRLGMVGAEVHFPTRLQVTHSDNFNLLLHVQRTTKFTDFHTRS